MIDTLLSMFEKASETLGEPILFAVVGQGTDKPDPQLIVDYGPVEWDKAKEVLNYKFSNRYLGDECHPVYVWTQSYVLFTHSYDRLITIRHVPRNPKPCLPEHSGSSVLSPV